MDGLVIIKDKSKNVSLPDPGVKLYNGNSNIDVTIHEINAESDFMISPAEDQKLLEFFYVVEGNASISDGDSMCKLHQFDSFYIKNLNNPLLIVSDSGAKILSMKSKQLYENNICDLNDLLNKTGEKDIYTYNHCKRVMSYSLLMSEHMKMDDSFKDVITAAALFHDIGKCYIPDEILKKPGELTKEQFRCVMRHPIHSRMLIEGRLGCDVAEIAEQHHEKLDGSGYPYGLKNNEIRLESKIIAVADVFDAMTTDRPYKKAVSYDVAIEELKTLAGKKYDSGVVDTLIEIVNNHGVYGSYSRIADESKLLEKLSVKI